MHTKKSAILFAAAWMAVIALMPLSKDTVATDTASDLSLSGVTVVIGTLPDAGPQSDAQLPQ